MIPTCPKCDVEYREIDNFCIECGKDLRVVKLKLKKIKAKNGYPLVKFR